MNPSKNPQKTLSCFQQNEQTRICIMFSRGTTPHQPATYGFSAESKVAPAIRILWGLIGIVGSIHFNHVGDHLQKSLML